ncbi:acetolactate synthase large subunit [Mesorhizobium sp. B2-1-3A]|uniref:acetolactate synthase large subunit n=1 Tax=Mesorhizobium sp. B2-1-3A TaxID=2589971 RepID=UPI0032B1738F
MMNGAESLVRTLLACGVNTCFANPGTSEMHFVAALDRIAGMRCVLGLFEGVVTGAADGYGRMTGKPAATLLHCGPGLANGLANLHNARRANTPIVNLVGDQATYHRPLDAPLTADTEGWSRPVSRWVRTSTSSHAVGEDAAAAVEASLQSPGGTASLILPSDVCWSPGGIVGSPRAVSGAPQVSPDAVMTATRLLRSGRQTAIILGGVALRAPQLELASRIAAATNARLYAPVSNARIERGEGRYPIARLPYPIDQAVKVLSDVSNVILVGATRPVAFFAYPDKPASAEPRDAVVHVLARPEQDLNDALLRLADELCATDHPILPAVREKISPPTGLITSHAVAQALSALLPGQSVIVDESVSFGRDFFSETQNAAPHDWLQLTGGAIGAGIPLATGAAIGAPGRRIVNLQADGSALYSAQGLWTQARENLDVTTIILSNRKYAILLGELANVGADPGRVALDMMSLENPSISWIDLAKGYGVEAAQAASMERFTQLLTMSFRRNGPFLIELVVP